MGYKVKVVKGKKKQKKQEIDEITLMSGSALAEDWLSPEDDVYNNL